MSVSRISQAYPDRAEVRGAARPLDDGATKQEPPLPSGSLRRSDSTSTLVQH